MIPKSLPKITIKTTSKKITPRAGLVLIEQLARELGLPGILENFFGHIKRRKRGLPLWRQLLDMASLLIDGGVHISDLRQLGADTAWKSIRGDEQIMAPRTARDMVHRFTKNDLKCFEQMERTVITRIAQRTRERHLATIDADATFVEADKKEAKMSYHAKRGYYPMVGFWAETGCVLQGEFRQGNETPNAKAVDFLKKCIAALPRGINKVRVRSDAAWFQRQVTDYCQQEGIEFGIGGVQNEAMADEIALIEEHTWEPFLTNEDEPDNDPEKKEWEIAETRYCFDRSAYVYRVVVIRKPMRGLELFKKVIYDYDVVITNMSWEQRRLIRWYWERCNCENHIKELKYGFGLNQFPCSNYVPNGVYFHLVILAYNLVQALQQIKLSWDWRYCRIKTLRYHLIHVAGILTRHARGWSLCLSEWYANSDLFKHILCAGYS